MTDFNVPPDRHMVRTVGRLGEIGGIIVANRLPMPSLMRPPMLDFDFGSDVAAVELTAAALGLEVQQYGPRVQVSWPPVHERAEGLPFATWHATVADPTGMLYGRGDEGEQTQPVAGRVPAHFADGQTGTEIEDGPVCQGAPAGYETDCGTSGAHGPHPIEPDGRVIGRAPVDEPPVTTYFSLRQGEAS